MVPVVVGLSVSNALPVDLATTYVLVIGIIAVLAASPKVPTPVRQTLGAAAVLTANVTLIEASGRSLGAHLVFACVLALLTLYQSWPVQLFAVGYLAFYYFALGSASPELIFPDGTDKLTGLRDGLLLFVTAVAACAPGVVSWYLTSRSAQDAETLRLALARASLREQQAVELNDTVVQDLVTALYAQSGDDREFAEEATRRALDSAREIVSSLMRPEQVPSPGNLVREAPAQNARSEHQDTPRGGQDD